VNFKRNIAKTRRLLNLQRKRQGRPAVKNITNAVNRQAEKNRIRTTARARAEQRKLERELKKLEAQSAPAASAVAVRSSARLAARRAGRNNAMHIGESGNGNGSRSRRAAAAANNYSKRNAKARRAVAVFGKKPMNKPIPFQPRLTPPRENERNELASLLAKFRM